MQHLSQASTPPIRTLWRNARMATMQGGQGWGWLEDAALLECNGRIVWVGKRADFLVLDANPLTDITNTRRISRIVIGNVEVDRAALLKLMR